MYNTYLRTTTNTYATEIFYFLLFVSQAISFICLPGCANEYATAL